MTKAVTKDSEGKVGVAINLYIQALDYFIPALECEFFLFVKVSKLKSVTILLSWNEDAFFCVQLKKIKQRRML